MKFDERGHELPDDTPVALPVGFKHPENINDTIKRLVRNELSRRAEEVGAETFEEADDFDIEDDPPDPSSPWELNFDQAVAVPPSEAVPASVQDAPATPAPPPPAASPPAAPVAPSPPSPQK